MSELDPRPMWWTIKGDEIRSGICACCHELLMVGEVIFRDSRAPSGRLYGICAACRHEIDHGKGRPGCLR